MIWIWIWSVKYYEYLDLTQIQIFPGFGFGFDGQILERFGFDSNPNISRIWIWIWSIKYYEDSDLTQIQIFPGFGFGFDSNPNSSRIWIWIWCSNRRKIWIWPQIQIFVHLWSLVHFQLSSPIFRDMIEYAWYASKLTQHREVFMNVKQVCFPERPCKTKCKCNNIGFIKCSWCQIYLCFSCFYDQYHPDKCYLYFVNVWNIHAINN